MNKVHLNRDDSIPAEYVMDIVGFLKRDIKEKASRNRCIILTEEHVDSIWRTLERFTLVHLYPEEKCPYCGASYSTRDFCPYCGERLWN